MADETNTNETTSTDTKKYNAGGQTIDVQALTAKIAELEKKLADRSSQEMGLNEKVKAEREDLDRKNTETRTLESALSFNLTSGEFYKQNESVLPKEIADILKMSDSEKYENGIQKANATKAAIVQCFFNVQDNLNLLTESQKVVLSDYLKLTKNGKESKAKEIYENIFEPALSTLKKVKKAEEVAISKMGYRSSKGDSHYREKLMKLSRQHYLGEKR